MYDIIVVGAGPAGMTAALYALRANKKVLVLEANHYGGQIVDAHLVENYPGLPNVSGIEYATNLYNQIKDLGCEIKYETVKMVREDKTVVTNKGEYLAKAVILATGAIKRKLHIPGEEEYIGKGVSYCATCDGNFYKNKTVAVVGGGSTALEDALYLSKLAKQVYLIHRRDTFNGEDRYLSELKQQDNVSFMMNANVVKINGEDVLQSVDVRNNDGEVSNIILDGLFIAVGQVPNNDAFANLVEVDDRGYIVSEDEVCTKTSGVYVAGDARVKKLRQLTTAVSDGSMAATLAIKEMK